MSDPLDDFYAELHDHHLEALWRINTKIMPFEPKPRATDKVFEFDDVKVFVDPKSLIYLDGMTLDWKDSLIQSGFAFDNPHAKKSCGCGTSFSA